MAEQNKREQDDQRDPSSNYPGYPGEGGKSELGEQPATIDTTEGSADAKRKGAHPAEDVGRPQVEGGFGKKL
jgi:hypothetical protein